MNSNRYTKEKNSKASTEEKKKLSFFKKAAILSISIFSFSLLFALVIAEILIRYVSPQMTLKQAKQVSLRAFSESEFLPYELIANLSSNHIGHTFEFDYQFHTNSLGLRGKEIDKHNKNNNFRVLMVGDSMTFGWGVEDNETIPSYLEQIANEEFNTRNINNKIEVINAGMASGFSPDTYYLYLKNKGLDLKPNLVIVNFFIRNDIYDLFETNWVEKDNLGYPTLISSKYRALKDGYFSYIEKDWKMQIPILNNSHLGMLTLTVLDTKAPNITNLIKSRLTKPSSNQIKKSDSEIESCLYDAKCPQEFEEKLEQLSFIMKGIKQVTEDEKTELLVVLIPDPYQLERVKNIVKAKDKYAFFDEKYDVKQSATEVLNITRPQSLIKQILEKENINYLDVLGDVVIKNSDELFFKGDGHYRKEGNGKIAKSLFNYLRNKIN